MPTVPLYPRLLGSSWHELAVVVRRHHLSNGILEAAGTFDICIGESWCCRLLAWLSQLPRAGKGVPTRLVITGANGSECWDRSFGSHHMTTWQEAGADGYLIERFGRTELRFALSVHNGGLSYHQVGAGICLGPVRIPLPNWLAPEVRAREEPDEQPQRTRVVVEVMLPLIGKLIRYSGILCRAEAP